MTTTQQGGRDLLTKTASPSGESSQMDQVHHATWDVRLYSERTP